MRTTGSGRLLHLDPQDKRSWPIQYTHKEHVLICVGASPIGAACCVAPRLGRSCIMTPLLTNPKPPHGPHMKPEPFLAELNRLRSDLDKDPADLEWLTLHHVFCFVSYKLADFQKYLNEAEAKGEFDEFKESQAR